jgi:hypothetical protein
MVRHVLHAIAEPALTADSARFAGSARIRAQMSGSSTFCAAVVPAG